jgi:chromo domain-containing protein 1
LLRKQINVFNITFNADELAPHPHINRLFPHGQAILITDSFLLFHPQEAARFLRWFHLQVLVTKPAGTWKLCVRPGIRDFLLAIIEEKSEEDGFVFMQMYESLYYIIPEDTVDDEDLEDDIELDTDLQEKPVRCMSSGVSNFDQSVGKNMAPRELLNEDRVSKNDAILVEWFAGWAMTQLESFRRFHIISGARSGRREAEKMEWEGKWSHVSVYIISSPLSWRVRY